MRKGLLAVCIQHEMDHLEGKLFVDYLSELKRQLIRRRMEKERKQRSTGANLALRRRALRRAALPPRLSSVLKPLIACSIRLRISCRARRADEA